MTTSPQWPPAAPPVTDPQAALLAAAQCGGGTPTQVKHRADTFLAWLREQTSPQFGYGTAHMDTTIVPDED